MTGFFNSMVVLAAEAGAGAGQAAQNGGEQQTFTDALIGIAPIILIIVVFFWLMNRSQKKRERERQEMLDSIRPKDDVVTVGGIKGRVVRIEDDELVLRIDPEKDIKVTMARTGIARRQGQEQEEA
ncbi:MAG: preprotein translocase subunit YajC [Planctomycetota bacterium]